MNSHVPGLPAPVEQATAAPGELRVVSDWNDRWRRCYATRIVQDGRRPAHVQQCTLPLAHEGDHAA